MNSKKLSILLIFLFIVTGILMFAVFDNKKINHPILKNDSSINTNIFEPIKSNTRSIELKISGIGEVVRNFK